MEFEIQQWLKKSLSIEQVAELVCRAMAKDIANQKHKYLKVGFSFLVNTGKTQKLFNFILEHFWSQPEKWPWAHLIETTSFLWAAEKPILLEWLIQGLAEQQNEAELGRSIKNAAVIADFDQYVQKRSLARKTEHLRKRQELFDQLITFRSQQLYDSEIKLLRKLELMFPNDAEIRILNLEHKKRYAFEILDKKLSARYIHHEPSQQPETDEDREWSKAIEQAHLEVGRLHPEYKKDLIVSALMLALPEVALTIVNEIPSYEDLTWLSLEALLVSRHYAELLNSLSYVELAKANDSETFFATAYLRAQAYWGLGQKEMALQVLEGLLASRPRYRSAESLWNEWRLS